MRNPYPVPDVSSEGDWIRDPVLAKKVSTGDRDWSLKVETHERLFSHHTLNSIRRDHRLVRTEVPNDALDFALSSMYIHSEDSMVPKMYVPMQPESLNFETWRVLRNEIHNNSFAPVSSMRASSGSTSNNKNRSSSSSGSKKAKSSNKKAVGSKKQSVGGGSKKAQGKGGSKKPGGGGSRSGGRSAAGSGKVSRTIGGGNKGGGGGMASKAKNKSIEDDTGDDVLDKESRRKNFAAQMMAIERIHPSSIKLAIDGPHTDQTNPGFSRKIDGTFYSI